MLEARYLSYERNAQLLFSNLTFEAKPGTFIFVSGKNGSGKSSLLKILAGLWRPTAGELLWQGQRLNITDPMFTSQLLYLGHKLGLQPTLTLFQNLQWLLGISSLKSYTQAAITSVLAQLGIQEFGNIPCGCLSKGQQQRLALARLWLDPRPYWVLDEPATALDEAGQNLLDQQIAKHVMNEGFLVMASHRSSILDSCKQINKIEVQLGKKTC